MAQLVARLTCPNCRQTFAAPVEQILDVEVDPTAKTRLLAGQVNLVICPACGFASTLDIPFIYHDRKKELALVFMPMSAGRTDLERQQAIGALSRAVMSTLPQEQRKGYLLNPQVFFSYESLVNRVLEADGITQEMIQAQRERAELLKRLLEAATPEDRLQIVRENEARIDEDFFRILQLNLEQADLLGNQEAVRQLLEIQAMLAEQTPIGRRLAARTDAVRALREQPTRENLLNLLISTEDAATRNILIRLGLPLVDYLFFQKLTARIEAAETEAERQRLEALREEVLKIREKMREEAREVVSARLQLVRELLASEEPELLARRRLVEMDDLFLNVLASEIEAAQQAGDSALAERLQNIWQLVMKLFQEQVPPELVLLTRLAESPDDETTRRILQENGRLLNEQFLTLLEQAEKDMRERGEEEVAQRLARALEIARPMVQTEERRGKKRETTERRTTPSGLIIARG